MKNLIASLSTLAFVAATFGLMMHAGYLILAGGTIAWIVAWFVPIAIASVAMGITDAPSPLSETTRG